VHRQGALQQALIAVPPEIPRSRHPPPALGID
jgi:hypothetical protein